MAITLNGTTGVTTTGLTSNGIDDNATSTAMTLDTSGNVGINTISPAQKLNVNGRFQIDAGWEIKLQNAAQNGFAAIQNAGAGTNTDLGFSTAGSERMRIDSNGALLLGTTSRSIYYNSVNAYNASAVIKTNVSNEVADLVITNGNNNFGSAVEFARTNSAGNDVRFATISALPTNNTAGSEAGVIRFYTKDTGDSNIVERMRIQAGGGISFNGDTAAANALDDYEEGTWTPTIGFGSVGGATFNGSYATQLARYTKIGNQVTVWVYLALQTKGTTTGIMRLYGLPFAPDNSNLAHTAGLYITYWYNWAGTQRPGSFLNQGAASMTFIDQQPSNQSDANDNTDLNNTSSFYGCATYKVP